jgi:cytochrome c-type protein NapC
MIVSRLMLTTALAVSSIAAATAAPNWAAIPARTVTLFQPGQTSLEWLMTPADHKGADKFRAGKDCVSCHTGEEKVFGDKIASGKRNEPSPITGKPGSISAKVQFAHDAQRLYVHLEFSDAGQPDAKMDKPAAKVAMMLDDGGVPEAARAGCWAACHDDTAGMASAKGSPRSMYLGKTRAQLSRQGGGDALKPARELTKLKSGGYLFEYWDAQLNPGVKPVAASGTVFDRRLDSRTVVTAEATHAGTMWSVTLARKLTAGAVAFAPGKRYTVAFAIDAGHTAKRYHYVSFERSLVLDHGTADFVAK